MQFCFFLCCCLHASFSVGGGTLFAETTGSCLRVILSNSACTSVKPGFCPWENGRQSPTVISCSVCACVRITLSYGQQADRWMLVMSYELKPKPCQTHHQTKSVVHACIVLSAETQRRCTTVFSES